MTVGEWEKYRNLHREFKFKARFKVTNYQPAHDDRSAKAVTNASLAQHRQSRADFKPLPDLIPKKRPNQRSDSESSPLTHRRKKSTESGTNRKTSFDGDISKSDTDPSDRDGKLRKTAEPLSKSAIRNQMQLNKVK